MAGRTTPPHGATRFVETTRGILSYTQLAPLLAERALVIERSIALGEFAATPIGVDFFRDIHRRLCGDLVPDWGGRWRTIEVQVGSHHPPPAYKVPLLMADFVADLGARLDDSVPDPVSDRLTEHLAFGEGRLLSIHPFTDFNGRVTRLWLRELLRRLDLPDVELVPATLAATEAYLGALRAADSMDLGPLQRIWAQRLGSSLGDESRSIGDLPSS